MEMLPSEFLEFASVFQNAWDYLKKGKIHHYDLGEGIFENFITPQNHNYIVTCFPHPSRKKEGETIEKVLTVSKEFKSTGSLQKITLPEEIKAKYEEYKQERRLEEEKEKRMLDEVKKLFEEQLQRKAEERGRNEGIRQFCQNRKIEHLTHFTHVTNLYSILSKGLFDRLTLDSMHESNKIKYKYTDLQRLDGHKEAISLSISFPNYRMFFKKRNNQEEWVVLLLEPSVLWELDCAFYHTNAASSGIRDMDSTIKKGLPYLKKMFADEPLRKKLSLPDNYTTDDQAEVLVFEHIMPEYIKEVHFVDYSTMVVWLQRYGDKTDKSIKNDKFYFEVRSDFYLYQNLKRDEFSKFYTNNTDFFF